MAITRTVVVAGAGIGGLTASLALAAKGFRVVILEKAPQLEEVGAGLQLSPNASSILVGLGLEPRLAPRAVTPDAISVISTRAGGEIARLPLGKAASRRAGSPYWVMHRADLQRALQAEVEEHPDIELRLGWQFEDVADNARGLMVAARCGEARQHELAAALIGADGIWSSVRARLFPKLRPQFSGLIAWRGTLDAKALPREYTTPRVQLWMGPNAHLVAYPIAAARRINVVAIVAGTWNPRGWSETGDAGEIKNAFSAHWPDTARMLIGAVDEWRRWALFTMPEVSEWSAGAVALLGDAVHGMLPFAAQGAGMAIEDAAVLANCLSGCSGEDISGIPAALRRYTRLRRGRVDRVRRTAQRQGRIYHLTGPMALARDLVIQAMGPERMLARQDWIYDWRV
ncbi:FAD-dependent monooxygenase [Bradyrhizobium sp. Ai1a-2]|uniref:FAD-dependent monooxygenase n=1 Tax=Bradyrhizobium sp. Ai1a-2 TaxID=196490 RepID=UPI0003FD53A6|nr:FAD-dependent monooxygenase [Bradyrhizobium sp. Ai1a-2]